MLTPEEEEDLKATALKYKALWERSNEVAAEYREKCIEMQELHKRICDRISSAVAKDI